MHRCCKLEKLSHNVSQTSCEHIVESQKIFCCIHTTISSHIFCNICICICFSKAHFQYQNTKRYLTNKKTKATTTSKYFHRYNNSESIFCTQAHTLHCMHHIKSKRLCSSVNIHTSLSIPILPPTICAQQPPRRRRPSKHTSLAGNKRFPSCCTSTVYLRFSPSSSSHYNLFYCKVRSLIFVLISSHRSLASLSSAAFLL